MKLQHLTYTKCPLCGSKATDWHQSENCHVNGHYFETIQFACDYKIEFTPNFMEERILRPCRNSDEFKKFYQKRQDAKKEIFNYIDTLDVDKEYKSQLKDYLNE